MLYIRLDWRFMFTEQAREKFVVSDSLELRNNDATSFLEHCFITPRGIERR